MSDLYDRLENRATQTRESALFRDLRHILTVARSRVPALRAQLKGVDVAALAGREDLARIPVLRRRDLAALQADTPPFGGTCATRPSALKAILLGAGDIAVPEGQAKDWWGAARALHAAGLRKGVALANGFSQDGDPRGAMAASGAGAMGCPVLPLAALPLALRLDAVARFRPGFYCGPADGLKDLLDHAAAAEREPSPITHALVFDRLSPGLRSEFALRGIAVHLAFATPELGLVAFGCEDEDGLVLNEGLICEFVEPGTGTPAATGEPGEVVVTRLNADYPLLRFGTGAVSAALPQPAESRRTNQRLRAPEDGVGESAEFGGTRIHSAQIAEIARRHPTLGRLRLVVRRAKEEDVLILRAEHRGDEMTLSTSLSETLHKITRMRGTVEFVTPGTLPDDDGVIIDERPLN